LCLENHLFRRPLKEGFVMNNVLKWQGAIQPENIPTLDDLDEPLDKQSEQSLLEHANDDADYDDDNSAHGFA
jgi:hypothetical protein